jgi:hypothetical protein
MNRRDFIARGAALAASSVVGIGELEAQPARGAACGGPPSGVQLFTVREALGRDPRGALRSLKEIGVVEAELFGLNGPESATLFGLPASDLKRAFDENGIRVPISHVGGGLTSSAAIADIAKTLGLQAVCVALPSEFSGPGGMVPARDRAQLVRSPRSWIVWDAVPRSRPYVRLSQPSHRVHTRRRRRAVRLSNAQHGSGSREDRARHRLARNCRHGSRDVLAPAQRPRHRLSFEGLRPARGDRRAAAQARAAWRRHDRLRRGARGDARDGRARASSKSTSPTTRSATCAAGMGIFRS